MIFMLLAVLSLDELKTLNKSLGFISTYADKCFKLATTYDQKFLSPKASTVMACLKLWKIHYFGVIDFDIWPEHASLKDHGMPAGCW